MALIEVYQGDSQQINLSFTSDSGTPLNLSGYTIDYTVKRFYADATPTIFKSITSFTSAISGLAQLNLTTGDTSICVGNYAAAITLIDPQTGVTTYNTDGLSILPSPFGSVS